MDYENIKVPMTCSVPLGLLKEFDEVARTKKSKRSSLIVKLMKLYVDKEKNFTAKNNKQINK